MTVATRRVVWLRDLGLEDVPLVGGKNASLGEMIRSLGGAGIRVPDGFAVTSAAYREFLREGGVVAALRRALAGLDPQDTDGLAARGHAAREAIRAAEPPKALAEEVLAAYDVLRAGGSRRTWRSAPRRPPRTCRRRASPASRRPS